MAIDLSEKNNHDIRKTVEYNDEYFSNVNLDSIRDNKRIFIPCDELPEDEKQCCSYLDSLIAFIESETGIHCSYFFVRENEPYELNGVYIQVAPELIVNNNVIGNHNSVSGLQPRSKEKNNEYDEIINYFDSLPIRERRRAKVAVIEYLEDNFPKKKGT